MTSWLRWMLLTTLSAAALVGVTAALSGGCVYERCECPCLTDGGGDVDGDTDGDGDGGGPCEGPVEETYPRAFIDGYAAPGNYVTLEPGGSVDLAGVQDPDWTPPMDCLLPYTWAWDLGNGDTSDEQAPGSVSFTTPGYYTIDMTATNSQGTADQLPDSMYVTIWNGTVFEDDFEGNPFDWDNSGWSRRTIDMINAFNPDMHPSPMWTVVPNGGGHRIYSGDWGQAFDYCSPGSQAMLARGEATNARMHVLQFRQDPDPPEAQPHFTDLILRYRFNALGTTGPNSTFYRVRVEEITDSGHYCICLDAFRIDGEDEGGTGLETSTLTSCDNMVCDYAGDTFYIETEISGGASRADIAVALYDSPSSSTPFNSHTFVDTDTPITTPGRFGISQCVGETYFDDFRLERLD